MQIPIYKFLIIRPDKIGDAIVTMVVVKALKMHVPCLIDVLASDYNYQFFKDCPYIDNLYFVNPDNKQQLKKYYSQLCNNKMYDIIFVMQSRKRLQKLTNINHNSIKVGLDLVYDKSMIIRFYKIYMKLIKRFIFVKYDLQQHEVLSCLNLLNVGLKYLNIKPISILSPYCELYNKNIIKVKKIPKSLVINYAGNGVRSFVNLNFLKILKFIKNRNFSKIGIIVTSDMYNDFIKMNLSSHYPDIQIIQSQNIFDVINCIEYYEYFLGFDGGLLHIATALKLKCIALYSKEMSIRWHPWTNKNMYQLIILNEINYNLFHLRKYCNFK